MGNGGGGRDEDQDPEEGLAEAAEAAGEEAPARLGHGPADSNTTDEPDADTIDDPAEVDYVELVKVHNAPDRNEAKLVKGILEAAQIPCVLEDDAAESIEPLIGSHLDGIDIFCPADFFERAQRLLKEQGIDVGIDEKRLAELTGEMLERAMRDLEARKAWAAELAQESRDFRHEVLAQLAKRGQAGLEFARTLLREAIRAEEDGPLIYDIPRLAHHGTWGARTALLLVDDLAKLAKDPDPRVRRRVARALGMLRGAGAGPTLVDLLSDEDSTVRDEALESLYALSDGEDFDFDPELAPEKQEEAIAAWRAWVRDNPAA